MDKRHRLAHASGSGARLRRGLVIGLAGACLTTAGWAPHAPAGPLDGFSSDNVEFLGNVPHDRADGGVLAGRYFYVIGTAGTFKYDVSRPEAPREVASRPTNRQFTDPAPETNGRILVCSRCAESRFGLRDHVFDVRGKTLQPVAALPDAHHWSCVLDCTWAFANDGQVVDLRVPSDPVTQRRSWCAGLETRVVVFNYQTECSHDVTEVAPGIILTASVPMYLLDVRGGPDDVDVLGHSDASPYSYGGVAWPGFGRHDILLSTNESVAPPRCEVNDALKGSSIEGAFKTWDGGHWKEDGSLRGLETYSARNGVYADGEPALSGPVLDPEGAEWGCAPGLFDAHPNFVRNGLVAQAWLGHGVKFLRVHDDGEIEQVGHFLGHNTQAMGVDWITDEIVYVADRRRGIDILRFKDDA